MTGWVTEGFQSGMRLGEDAVRCSWHLAALAAAPCCGYPGNLRACEGEEGLDGKPQDCSECLGSKRTEGRSLSISLWGQSRRAGMDITQLLCDQCVSWTLCVSNNQGRLLHPCSLFGDVCPRSPPVAGCLAI